MQPEERDAAHLWDMLEAARAVLRFTEGPHKSSTYHYRTCPTEGRRQVSKGDQGSCPTNERPAGMQRHARPTNNLRNLRNLWLITKYALR